MLLLLLFGCYAQVAKNEIDKIPEIDFSIGTNEKSNIVKYVEQFYNSKRIDNGIKNLLKQTEYEDFGNVTYTEKTRAVIKVQDGCDNFCTYCIIPYARGRARSRNSESILSEIKDIVRNDIKEVVITGIHIASYGKDFNNNYKLIDLLEDINKIDNINRIRLGSIEPKLMTEEFLKRLRKLDKICHHFHLSLQSGCTETIKRMNRKYTIEEFKVIVNNIRKTYNDVILTTDIIVGFPGETDKEFEETYEFLKDIKFYKMHVFKYSERKGTKAALMENQVSPKLKEERSRKLLLLSDENGENYQKQYIGKRVDVLFEEFDGEYYKGHTANYIMVKCKSDKDICNEIKEVTIEENNELELIGEM